MSEISKVCDRVGLVKGGTLLRIETIEEMRKKSVLFVTIESDEIEKIKNALNITTIYQHGNEMKFKNQLSMDSFIRVLAQYHISKLLIEEGTLEDMLLEEYQ